MSGPAIHHIIGKEYLYKVLRARYTDTASLQFWDNISAGKFAPVYNLGTQGPDFLFFKMSDWPLGGAIKPLAQTYWEIEEFIEDFKEQLKALIPDEVWALISTLETLAEEAVERSALLSEISALLSDVQNNIDALKAVVETKIEEYITGAVDIFNRLSHPQQHGQKYNEWWWFDILHIRRSGRFVKELLRNSTNFSPERAYALGYLTHYTADTVGHVFVNAISGGPYRTHAQRHKIVENHQDVWAYQQKYNAEFVNSDLAGQYVIDGNEDALPDSLKKFMLKCIENTYYKNGSQLYGIELKGDDLDIAYKCWLKWFKRATNDLALPTPQPYSLTAEIVEAWDKFTQNVGDFGDTIGNGLSGNGGILGFFEALAALIAAPFILAAAAVDFVAGEIATLGAAPIRYFLSLTYEALYNSYMNFRQGIVLNGFSFPTVAGLNHSMTKHMLNTSSRDRYGNDANSLPLVGQYPSSKFKRPGLEAESHLVYPWPILANLEIDNCTGFPTSYYGKTAEWYMSNAKNRFIQDNFNYFKSFQEISIENLLAAEVTANFSELARVSRLGGLGNALALSDVMYANFLRVGNDMIFPDFCLDSDRGYGFKSWRKVKDISYINKQLNDPALTNVPIQNDRTVPNIQTDILDSYGGAI
ncbi:zinc dependent phospholipase C family protein [Desulfobacter postgatei]|uniref:zinc dependent phospholipase C family protein n=1 Tax=Desulfobacter postgatei TaxID=2293 RepID=UPI00259B344E|nr:zinc dependent phospholipase C family protein [uncultured Desulfobacter sp.]